MNKYKIINKQALIIYLKKTVHMTSEIYMHCIDTRRWPHIFLSSM